MSNKKLFIISGPSGAGEDSIIEGLKKYFPIERVITVSTRSMRADEQQGSPYWFISRKEFIRRRNNGEFIEWAKHYNGNLYGVTKEEIKRVINSGKIGIWKIDYKGVITAKKIFPKIPTIFITASSLDTLKNRIRRRDGVTKEYIKERMRYTKEWMKHKDIYDHIVVNEEGKLDEAIKKTAEIIKKYI